jgi:ABC-type multidrug transport system fused ATPase/permease subunit
MECRSQCSAVDGPLAQYSLALLMTSVLAGSRIIAIVVSAPVFLLPSMVIGVIGGLLGRVYMTAQLSVKRARSNAKAPVVAEVNDAFAGLVSIRAFGKEAMFMRSCAGKINEYSRLSIHFQNLNRWISVRIQVRRLPSIYT